MYKYTPEHIQWVVYSCQMYCDNRGHKLVPHKVSNTLLDHPFYMDTVTTCNSPKVAFSTGVWNTGSTETLCLQNHPSSFSNYGQMFQGIVGTFEMFL